MKLLKTLVSLICFTILLGIFPTYSSYVEARSGCCSHHGGVCGCGCCDGTGLSATCAPYYPQCNSGYSDTSTYQVSTPSCTANATYDSTTDKCICNTGYAASLNRSFCVKIPQNAHAVSSSTDVWQCDIGYKEISGACLKEQITITATPKVTPIVTPLEQTKPIQTASNPDNATADPTDTLSLITIASLVGGAYLLSKRKPGN